MPVKIMTLVCALALSPAAAAAGAEAAKRRAPEPMPPAGVPAPPAKPAADRLAPRPLRPEEVATEEQKKRVAELVAAWFKQVEGAEPSAPEAARIGELIAGLGAEQYAVREAAQKGLEDIGRPALGALRAALGSRDPEVALRAGQAMHRIEAAATRDTIEEMSRMPMAVWVVVQGEITELRGAWSKAAAAERRARKAGREEEAARHAAVAAAFAKRVSDLDRLYCLAVPGGRYPALQGTALVVN